MCAWDLKRTMIQETFIHPPRPPQAHALMTRLPSVNPVPTTFPALLLLVSGGHNMLVLSEGVGKHRIIGTTLDDRCGRCVSLHL